MLIVWPTCWCCWCSCIRFNGLALCISEIMIHEREEILDRYIAFESKHQGYSMCAIGLCAISMSLVTLDTRS